MNEDVKTQNENTPQNYILFFNKKNSKIRLNCKKKFKNTKKKLNKTCKWKRKNVRNVKNYKQKKYSLVRIFCKSNRRAG